MTSGLLLGLCLIPSMLFAFALLTTFYGANRAYLAISWLPIAFALLIWVFRLLLSFEHSPDDWWRDLFLAVGWASLVQAGLGGCLIVRALYQRRGAIVLLLATSASASPFLLRFVQ